jgi:hypothetical protein
MFFIARKIPNVSGLFLRSQEKQAWLKVPVLEVGG